MNCMDQSKSRGSYTYIYSGYSIKRPVKYCDIVGFRAKYTCPRSGMHYYNAELHDLIDKMPRAQKDAHLEMRKANVVLK